MITASVSDLRGGAALSGTGMTAQVESYSWSARGGPEVCTIKIQGNRHGISTCLDWLRFPVMVRRGGAALWWGFVNRVDVDDGAWRMSSTLENSYNGINALYTEQPSGASQLGTWYRLPAESMIYGDRELLIDVRGSVRDERPTAADLAPILEEFRRRPVQIQHGDLGILQSGATLHCVGWAATLGWKYTYRFAYGHYGSIVSSGDWINLWHLGTDPPGTNREYAMPMDFEMFDPAPVEGEQYMHLLRVSARNNGNENSADGIVRLEGREPDVGGRIGAPDGVELGGRETIHTPDLGGGRNVDLYWTQRDTILPDGGWYVVFSMNGYGLQVRRQSNDPWASASVIRRCWGQDRTGQDWLDRGEPTGGTMDVFTRLGVIPLLKALLLRAEFISSAGAEGALGGSLTDAAFYGYLDGTQYIGEFLDEVADVADLYYIVTPSRHLRLLKAGSVEDGIHTGLDGRFPADFPEGECERLMARQIIHRDWAGLCTGARYEVREGEYALSFRGAPSVGVVQRRRYPRNERPA